MPHPPLRIATRKSQLAIWQANYIKQKLEQLYADIKVEIMPLVTEGDRLLSAKLADFGGKGLFVKELEQALLENQADIAVHSMKDLPIYFPDGLKLGAICAREDPRDVFIANHYLSLDSLPQGARVGTSSLRRQCQLKRYRNDIEFIHLRGNVDTRLYKLDENEMDAIILAAAGMVRLGFDARIREFLSEEFFIPAVGQGALGIECRAKDNTVAELIWPLNHAETAACVAAERSMNERLGGGCHAPIAGHAKLVNHHLTLRGMVANPLTNEYLEDEVSGADPQRVGFELAEKLIAKGAERLFS